MALYLIVVQAHFVMNNIFEGMIWFFLPASLVITNDIFAYICGITFGKTQLIKLSPKKTVEGFVGAWVCTIIFGYAMTNVLMRYKYFICPVNVRLRVAPNPSRFEANRLGPRRKYLYWSRMQTQPSLCSSRLPNSLPPHRHSPTLLFPHPLHRQNSPHAVPHPRFRNLRLSHRSLRRLLCERSQTHLQSQGFRRIHSRPRWNH